MKSYLYIATIVLAVSFAACSDDVITVDQPLQNTFYPLSDSSYSIMRSVFLKENNAEIAESESIDSLTWGRAGTFFGASGRPQYTFYPMNPMDTSQMIDTNYVSNANNMVHWYMEPIELPGLSPAVFQSRWMRIADFGTGATGWTMLNDSLKGLTFIADTNWRFSGKVLKNAVKGGMVTVNYGNNQTISAQEFTYTTTFDGIVTLDTVKNTTNTSPLQFTINERTYFAENIGLVRYERDFAEAVISSGRFPVYGRRIVLLQRGRQ